MTREKNYRYHECAIVCGDVECYEKYAKSIFELYDIPYFVDIKTSILYHPCIELIRAVLEMVEKDFSYESVFRFFSNRSVRVYGKADVGKAGSLAVLVAEGYVVKGDSRAVLFAETVFSL